MARSKQLSLSDIHDDCFDALTYDKPKFLRLLDEYIDIDDYIPWYFKDSFYLREGRPREYPLSGFLWAFIIQMLFSIPTITLLITFLNYSREIREFCGFTKVPDPSKFTRFKQDFKSQLDAMFHELVDITEPICQEMDESLAKMLIYDTSGIEAYVTENNPKFANSIIRQLKAWKKSNGVGDSFDPYKVAYSRMPSCAATNSGIKQMYINGHFCYAYKIGVLTNGLGIIRDISFFDKNYLIEHPDINVQKKSTSPDEDKTLADSKSLLPVLSDFLNKHPDIKPDTFIGDSAFDSIETYDALLGDDMPFVKALIPLNSRNESELPDCSVNADGIPCCPKDSSLPMKREGSKSHLRCGMETFKFVCPKMKWVTIDGKNKRITSCDDPCTDSPCGRMFYIYPQKDYRLYPGMLRGSDEWYKLYKKRTAIERSINHFKSCYHVSDCKTQNADTIHADLLISGITQLLSVIIADKIGKHELVRSLKPIIA